MFSSWDHNRHQSPDLSGAWLFRQSFFMTKNLTNESCGSQKAGSIWPILPSNSAGHNAELYPLTKLLKRRLHWFGYAVHCNPGEFLYEAVVPESHDWWRCQEGQLKTWLHIKANVKSTSGSWCSRVWLVITILSIADHYAWSAFTKNAVFYRRIQLNLSWINVI